MTLSIFKSLGLQLRDARRGRGLTQPQLAARLGRDRSRISELERDLTGGRLGRDRLTLLVEACDALNLVPILVPARRLEAVRAGLRSSRPPTAGTRPASMIEELFVDLSDDEAE